MSLDFDRSADGEPTVPASKAPERASPSVPTFTPAPQPADSGPAADESAAGESPVGEPAAAGGGSAGRAAGIEPAAGLDGPLLSDANELRTSWQRIQAAFVDDPREAVADAAGLVEHTAQALAGALRLRQRQLRAMWDRDGMPDGVEYADSGGTAPRAASPDGDRQAADGPDTEQLRLLIQRYRVLFNDLCRP